MGRQYFRDGRDHIPMIVNKLLSKGVVAQARQRLGEALLKWLFQTSARAWSSQDRNACLVRGRAGLAEGILVP